MESKLNNKLKIDLLLECSLCYGQLVNNRPKSLPCLHTFCAPCLTNNGGQCFKQDANILCPVCHTIVSRSSEDSEIINNLELDVIIEKILRAHQLQQSEHHCGMCRPEKDVVSTKWCRDCEKSLCDSCLVHHIKYKPKDKVIDLPIERNGSSVNVSDFILPTKCSRHEKKLKMYCSQCDTCLCSTCSIEHDKNENCALVSIGIDALGTKAQEGLNLLEEMSSRLEKEQQQIDDMKVDIDDLEKQFNTRSAEVWKNVEETIRRLKENARAFVAEMEAVTKSEIEELEKSIRLKEDCIKEMEMAEITFRNLLQSFDTVDILLNYSRLESKCKNLLMQLNNNDSHGLNMEYNDWYLSLHEKSENLPLARCWKDLKLTEASSPSSSSDESLNAKRESEISRFETRTSSWLTYLRRFIHPIFQRTTNNLNSKGNLVR